MKLQKLKAQRAFTLVETIMAMASVGSVGLAIFYTLYSGLLLYTKNTAMNVSHEEARLALLQLQTDLHGAVSPISLTDSNGNMVSGTASNAGVEFQAMLSSTEYCRVSGSTNAGVTQLNVSIPTGYPQPYVGTRLIIPAFECEGNVTAISISGTVATCTIDTATTNAIDGTDNNIPCFFTQRVYYYVNGPPNYVQGGTTITPPLTMTYVGMNRTKTYSVGSEDLTCRDPFSIPAMTGTAGTSGTNVAPNYRAVTITGLTAEDPNATNLNTIFHFSTSSIMLSGQVPEYATVTTYQ